VKPARIVLADDHPLIREAIRSLLTGTSEFTLVGEAADGKECLARVRELRPEIVLVDIAMPKMSGEHVTADLRRLFPDLKIIALSGYTDRQFVRAMVKAGANAYVVKSASGRELIHALRAVAGGNSYLSPEITSAVMSEWDTSPSAGRGSPEALGKREREVLQLVAEGYRTANIAAKMGITAATVESHRRNIMRKLKLHSVADLTRFALRHGLVRL
jgi:two-component system NarL family response regulator